MARRLGLSAARASLHVGARSYTNDTMVLADTERRLGRPPHDPWRPLMPALTGHSAVRTENLTARVQRADKGASYSAGHEDQDESGHEFPLQRAVHCGNSL